MIRGLYTSAWSMLANEKKMDVISNNLANANTTAYKKDTVVFESFPEVLTKRIHDTQSSSNPSGNIGTMQLSSDVGEIFTYYRQGSLIKSDNRLDLSIQDTNAESDSSTRNEAFFTVSVPDGNGNAKEYYTRDGSFVLNANKQLVTKDGYPVMGENGPITLNGDDFTVQDDGTIEQNGQVVDKLKISEFSDTTTLRKFGSDLVAATADSKEQQFSGIVKQGYVEQSNVNVIKEMVDMITVMRTYEANQKMLQTQDNTLDKAVNEVGVVK